MTSFEFKFFIFGKPYKATFRAKDEADARRQFGEWLLKSVRIDSVTISKSAATEQAEIKEFERFMGQVFGAKSKGAP